MPTYQYSTVPVELWQEVVQRIKVESEILITAFIPDYDETAESRSDLGMSLDAYHSLLKEAYKITGNEYDPIVETRGSEWHPSGRITAFDQCVGDYIPVKGVRIRGTHLLKTHETLTNANGEYRLKSFKNPVNIKIVWESEDWDIRLGNFGQAVYDGPKIKNGKWDLAIDMLKTKTVRYAAVHRAAYRYYYGVINGFARPSNSRKEKICFMDSEGTGTFWGNVGFGVLPDIKVFSQENGTYKRTDYIFRTTIHELAHAAHCTWMTQIQFWQVNKLIYESWAEFVEWAITQIEYAEYGSAVSVDSHQDWPLSKTDLEYSSLFIDLVDTYNQGLTNPSLPFDEVDGFTYNQLNIILLDSYGLPSLKTNVKIWKPYNISNQQIDNLFYEYENTSI